jgi:hypothetical protein
MRQLVPFFGVLHTPSRFAFLVLFSFILMFSRLSIDILSSLKDGRIRLLFFLLLSAMFLIDFFPINYDSYYDVETPEIIFEMGKESDDYIVLNLPMNLNTQGMYLQTIHHKKNLDGCISRTKMDSLKTISHIDHLSRSDVEEMLNELKMNDVRYVIAHKGMLTVYEFNQYKDIFSEERASKIYENDIVVYRIKD